MKNKNANGILSITKLKFGEDQEFVFDIKDQWMEELENELAEEVLSTKESFDQEKKYLRFKGILAREKSTEFGECILCNGKLEASYPIHCIKSGKLIYDSLEIEINALFIDESYKQKPEYEDEIEFYYKQELRDLYFYTNQEIDLKETFHEYLYLNKNYYPQV